MNIVQLYDYIKQYALTIPIVKSYYNTSVYECWNNQNVKYGSVVFVVKSVREQNSIAKFDCVLYYGDRLNDNKTNRDAIQSDAIGVINNIVSRLNCSDNIEFVTYPVQSTIFEQKFADELAGAYANLTIDLQSTGDCCDYNLLDDYYTKEQIDKKLDDLAAGDLDLSDYYTKAQIDKKLTEIEEGDIDLTNYYTKQQIDSKGYLTAVPSEYVTETELNAKGYLTSVPSQYVTENELTSKKYLTAVPSEYVTESELEERLKNVSGNVDLTGYATEQWVEGKGYLNTSEVNRLIENAVTEGLDLSDYYTKQQIDNKGFITSIPSEYVTENELEAKGYITSIPSEYVTESKLESKGYLTSVPSQYVTEAELAAKKYLTAVPSEYVTESELTGKNYVTKVDLDGRGYATKSEVTQQIEDAVTSGIDLSNYYTKSEINNKGYITTIPSEYVTESELESKGYLTAVPSQYVTENELNAKGYLTSVPSQYVTESELETRLDELNLNVDLTDYYTKSQIDGKGYITNADLVTKNYVTRSNLTSTLTDYYTESEADAKFQPKGNYLTSVPSEYVTETELTSKGYATTSQVTAKQDKLISGTNIKTVNGTSILGSGNIEIKAAAEVDLTGYATEQWVEDKGYITDTELAGKNYATTSQVNNKQDKLYSGTNIKTINGVSILGSGNIDIQGGTGGNVDLSNYYTKEQVDAMVGAVNQILDSLINDVDTEAIEVSLNNILNEI